MIQSYLYLSFENNDTMNQLETLNFDRYSGEISIAMLVLLLTFNFNELISTCKKNRLFYFTLDLIFDLKIDQI